MDKFKITKMVASGNDFVIAEVKAKSGILSNLARNVCDRKFGAGADGLLILEKSKAADIRMRIFNADGSEAEMCGNGARCTALFVVRRPSSVSRKKTIKIETKAGIIEAQVRADIVKIKLTDPRNIKLNIPIKVNNRTLHVNFIDTGVPHTVIFVEGLDKIDVKNLGNQIRFHKKFAPRGTNVNFVEPLSKDAIRIRTYERGVEDETLACGTGSVASSVIFALKTGVGNQIKVHTKSGEILNVYFKKQANKFRDVWLEGRARIVYKGEYYV